VNGNAKLGRAAARSGEWAKHFSNASCFNKRPPSSAFQNPRHLARYKLEYYDYYYYLL